MSAVWASASILGRHPGSLYFEQRGQHHTEVRRCTFYTRCQGHSLSTSFFNRRRSPLSRCARSLVTIDEGRKRIPSNTVSIVCVTVHPVAVSVMSTREVEGPPGVSNRFSMRRSGCSAVTSAGTSSNVRPTLSTSMERAPTSRVAPSASGRDSTKSLTHETTRSGAVTQR
jgi:hypothetical protein